MSKTVSTLAQALIAALTPFVTEGAGDTAINQIADTVNDTVKQETQDKTEFELWAMSSCGEFYIPYNKEFHSGGVNKVTAKGIFAKLRGVNPANFAKLEGAWLDQHGLEVNAYELVDGQPVAVEADEVVDKPKPTKPGGKPTPPKPGKPTEPGGKPTKPGEDFKAKALQHINLLTNEHSVDYDFLVEQLLTPFEVDSFEDLAEADHKAVYTEAKAWDHWLNQIKCELDKCQTWDEKHGDGLVEGFDATVAEYAESLGEVSRDNLGELHTAVTEYTGPWSTYYKELAEAE